MSAPEGTSAAPAAAPWPPRPPALAAARRRARRTTWSGRLLLVLGMLVALSGVASLRIEILGLSVHPYLLFLAPILLFAVVPRLKLLPERLLASLLVFVGLYVLSAAPGPSFLPEALKIVASLSTLLACALLVRQRADFHLGVLGLSLAALVLSYRGLGSSVGPYGLNPLEDIANKNAFSLYVLPSLLLAGFLVQSPEISKRMRLVLAASSVLSAVTVLSTGNRSGWLGVALIAAMLFLGGRRKIQAFSIVSVLGIAGYLLFTQVAPITALEFRLQRSLAGVESDQTRREMVLTAIEIGLEKPLLGASPDGLRTELARRLEAPAGALESHNVVGHLIGASGLIAFAAFLVVGWLLWHNPAALPRAALGSTTYLAGHRLMKMLLVLWLVRGMFTHEILYAPAFCMALGLALGLCLLEAAELRTRPRSPAP